MIRTSRLVAWVGLALLVGCREGALQSSAGELRLGATRLELPAVYPGGESALEVTLENSGRSAVPVRWEVPGEPFAVEGLPSEAPSGLVTITVRFKPQASGTFRGRLLLAWEGEGPEELVVEGTGLAIPPCPTAVACHRARFDVAEGRCVEEALPDGEPCESGSACVLEGSCRAGRCVGRELDCDDGNACTVDGCNPFTGCEHFPAPPCPGDGKCQVGACDPAIGCTLQPASDGTPCGEQRTCDLADVCIGGACVERDPPDGFLCEYGSPCQEAGRCVGSTCVQPEPRPLAPNWAFDSAQALPAPVQLHDFVLDGDGELSLMGWLNYPLARASSASPSAIPYARRCILWSSRLVCADSPGYGKVSAFDPRTGAPVWQLDLPAQRPDFAALSETLFMARVAALGSDRLAALFEAYPKTPKPPSQCRLYFLVILDPSGKMVAANQLADPLLDSCDHPHPYGVVSDVGGNLYLAFSSSNVGVAPLYATGPTLLVSYTRDGVQRWRRVESFTAGELAVARGLLFPERAGVAFSTSNGAPFQVQLGGAPLGRVVVTTDRIIPSPVAGAASLVGYQSSTGAARWTHRLEGQTFWSEQIRLAAWRFDPSQPPKSVALLFTEQAGAPRLLALDPSSGVEEWSCQLAGTYRTPPQLFEVVSGAMAVMEGSPQCGTCDPPFAQSSAAFHRYLLPGIEPAREPWVGTFGGPGHDHNEELLFTPPGTPQ